ncbi:MAG: hypothetical protein ABEL97_01600 [Salinibacter sp.]
MRFFRILLVLGLIGSLTACDLFERRDRTFQGDSKLEFFPLTATVDEGDIEAAGGSLSLTTSIQLIGPQRDSELPITFTVADSSTAVEGTHYTLPSTSATLPADSSSVPVQVNVLDNNADDGDQNYVLFLNLQTSNGVAPAENLRTFRLTLRGEDE